MEESRKSGRDMQWIQKAERRRLRLYRSRKALELLYLEVTKVVVSNIVYLLSNVFIATHPYCQSNVHALARRAVCHIVDIVGGMSLCPPKSKRLTMRCSACGLLAVRPRRS